MSCFLFSDEEQLLISVDMASKKLRKKQGIHNGSSLGSEYHYSLSCNILFVSVEALRLWWDASFLILPLLTTFTHTLLAFTAGNCKFHPQWCVHAMNYNFMPNSSFYGLSMYVLYLIAHLWTKYVCYTSISLLPLRLL